MFREERDEWWDLNVTSLSSLVFLGLQGSSHQASEESAQQGRSGPCVGDSSALAGCSSGARAP